MEEKETKQEYKRLYKLGCNYNFYIVSQLRESTNTPSTYLFMDREEAELFIFNKLNEYKNHWEFYSYSDMIKDLEYNGVKRDQVTYYLYEGRYLTNNQMVSHDIRREFMLQKKK